MVQLFVFVIRVLYKSRVNNVEFTRYLSYNGESRNVCLSAVVSGDHEKWLIYNDFVPNANESLESGGYVSTSLIPSFTL